MAAPVQRPRRADVPAQPTIGSHARQPHRKDCVKVECLPGRQPGIKQILERVQIARLALAKKRHAAIKSRAPPRESPAAQFLGEKSPIWVVDLGDIEVKERPHKETASQKNRIIAALQTKSANTSPRPQGRRSNSPKDLAAAAISPRDTTLASLALFMERRSEEDSSPRDRGLPASMLSEGLRAS